MTGAVAAGGALGALARAGLEALVDTGTAGFPWPLLLINAAGSFGLGALTVLLLVRQVPRWVGPTLGTGFFGGFTTFSAYVVGSGVLLRSGSLLPAVGYAVLTPALCVAAAALGAQAARLVAVVGGSAAAHRPRG